MLKFDDTKRDEDLAALRSQEEENFQQILAGKYGIPYEDLSVAPIDIEAIGVLKEDTARDALLAPFALSGKKLKVGIFSPNEEKTKEALANLTERGYTVLPHLVSHASLEKVWSRYGDISSSTKSEAGVVDIENQSIEDLVKQYTTFSAVSDSLNKTIGEKTGRHISNMFSIVLAGAIGIHASDIHIEPAEEAVHIRYRVDGVLHEVATLPTSVYRNFSSRLKLMAGLRLNVGSESQDGRFSIKISDLEIEMRVSVIPGPYGEGIVMRILNPLSINVTLEDLGMSARLLTIIQKEIDKPHGMILNTGPTGSGKTTTLYAFLKKIYSPEIKVMTIEDPIEYHMKGVSQTQVEEKKGYTFLEGLRAAMRQDPDVIMVGEIRDGETAKVAINAALTGHMVFSTLHTNTAAGTIPRLIELGVTPKIISSALTVALAQRLSRKLCVVCKKEDTPTPDEQAIIDKISIRIKNKTGTDVQTKKVWRAVGCNKCNETGYKGRIGIFEAILMTPEIEQLLNGIPSEREISEAAESQKLLNMQEDGVEKILTGLTSFDEVMRVVDLSTTL